MDAFDDVAGGDSRNGAGARSGKLRRQHVSGAKLKKNVWSLV